MIFILRKLLVIQNKKRIEMSTYSHYMHILIGDAVGRRKIRKNIVFMRMQLKHVIQFFREDLLRLYCMPGILLGYSDPLINRINRNAVPTAAYIQVACREGQGGSQKARLYFR